MFAARHDKGAIAVYTHQSIIRHTADPVSIATSREFCVFQLQIAGSGCVMDAEPAGPRPIRCDDDSTAAGARVKKKGILGSAFSGIAPYDGG